MHKNALFLLKNCKNCSAHTPSLWKLGDSSPCTQWPPAAGSSASRSPLVQYPFYWEFLPTPLVWTSYCIEKDKYNSRPCQHLQERKRSRREYH